QAVLQASCRLRSQGSVPRRQTDAPCLERDSGWNLHRASARAAGGACNRSGWRPDAPEVRLACLYLSRPGAVAQRAHVYGPDHELPHARGRLCAGLRHAGRSGVRESVHRQSPAGAPMNIWVDADACPKVIKEVLYRAAERTGVAVTLVANQPLQVPRIPSLRVLQVSQGFDVADNEIVRRAGPGDLVITADIPLA